ncbi:glycosyltransferase family 2 protein [Rhodobacteraceae bacterium M382]|nr:glycosyltransferase family 2 protein [Rhodobacteraceae bacterium M382]
MTATWHVGAILNEPLAETLRFAAWYLDAGATGLTLLFDNPQDPAIGVLGDHPQITCIPCTPEFWQARGVTQDTRFTKRQNVGLTWIYRQQGCDWLLNVDADEFMYLPDSDIAACLSDLPAEVDVFRVGTAEIVDAPDHVGRVYRLPMERDVAKRVYQGSAGYFGPRRKGLIGHSQGKSFVRSGLDGVTLRQHWAQRPGGLTERIVAAQANLALLHHIGLDYDVWRAKLDWRIQSRGFTVPLSAKITEVMQEPEAEDRLRALHADLHGMDQSRLERLRAEGVCLELPVDPDAVARRIFGTDVFSG